MITVHLPTGSVWGPGIQFDFSTNFIGPLPLGTAWNYSIFSVASPETALVGGHKVSQQSRETGVIGSPINDWPVITPAVAAAENADANVIINVVPPTGPAIDFLSFPIRWAPTSAVYSLVNSQASGGFHDPMLDTILLAVQKPLQNQP
jgi:hypothetical protein